MSIAYILELNYGLSKVPDFRLVIISHFHFLLAGALWIEKIKVSGGRPFIDRPFAQKVKATIAYRPSSKGIDILLKWCRNGGR